MNSKIVSQRIRQAMEMRGLRQIDLVEATGLSSQKISMYVNGQHEPKLVALGQIARALEVSEGWLAGFDVSMERDSDMAQESSTALRGETLRIPILGTVCAGSGMYAEQNIIGTVSVDPALGDDLFALRIHGDSMSPRISDGDTVIVRKQEDAESGQIVIAVVNGDEGVCKRLIKFNGGIVLQSLNPAYEPMTFTDEQIKALPVTIVGRVIQNRCDF